MIEFWFSIIATQKELIWRYSINLTNIMEYPVIKYSWVIIDIIDFYLRFYTFVLWYHLVWVQEWLNVLGGAALPFINLSTYELLINRKWMIHVIMIFTSLVILVRINLFELINSLFLRLQDFFIFYNGWFFCKSVSHFIWLLILIWFSICGVSAPCKRLNHLSIFFLSFIIWKNVLWRLFTWFSIGRAKRFIVNSKNFFINLWILLWDVLRRTKRKHPSLYSVPILLLIFPLFIIGHTK